MKSIKEDTTGLSSKKKEFIKFVISPGTAGSFLDAPAMVCPTGEKCLVMREMRMKQVTLTPDSNNKIIVLNTPFFEAPMIQVLTGANNAITAIKAFQLPGYPTTEGNTRYDQLKKNEIYGWRMIANSLTGVCDAAPIDATGSVTVAALPLSLDNKIIYQPSTTADAVNNPISWARVLDYIPLSANEVAGITNQFTTHKAVDGSYCVLRHTDANLPFTWRDSDANKATFNVYRWDATTFNLQLTDPAQQETLLGSNRLYFSNDTDIGHYVADESGNPLSVTMPSCMNLGITIFSGLKQNTPFTFKLVCAWEFVPKMNSSKIAQCRPMEPKDPFFLHMLNVHEIRTKSYGTAADNSFGTFIKGLFNTVAKVSPFVKEIAAVLPLPPTVKMVVDRVTDILPKVNAAVNKVANENRMLIAPAPAPKKKTQEVAIVNKGNTRPRK